LRARLGLPKQGRNLDVHSSKVFNFFMKLLMVKIETLTRLSPPKERDWENVFLLPRTSLKKNLRGEIKFYGAQSCEDKNMLGF
jgi:hypothetical protein